MTNRGPRFLPVAAAVLLVLAFAVPGERASSHAGSLSKAGEPAFAVAGAPADLSMVRLRSEERRDAASQRSSKHRSLLLAVVVALLVLALIPRARAVLAIDRSRPRRLRWSPQASRAPPPFQLLTV